MKMGFYSRYLFFKINALEEIIHLNYIRRKLRNKGFSIISNNCWGGSVYEDFHLEYKTPTIGLFFFAPCYIKFIYDLKNNLKGELNFISFSKYDKANQLRSVNPYPIGLLQGDIEIHFLHYTSERDALEKWVRRAERVNFDNLFFSFTDNEVCTFEEIKAFDALPYKKVFFSAKFLPNINSLVFLSAYRGQEGVGNLYDYRKNYRRDFNVLKWLNN
jgi:uncharacterized protein (DUF1919 family)